MGNQKAALAGGSERKVHRSIRLKASSPPAAMAEQGRDSAPEESDQGRLGNRSNAETLQTRQDGWRTYARGILEHG
jgi:hypothetical protein